MPTQNPRINVTLSPEHAAIIEKLAARDSMSISAKAKQMILQAMETDEDIYFSALAEKREREHTEWVSHEDAWK